MDMVQQDDGQFLLCAFPNRLPQFVDRAGRNEKCQADMLRLAWIEVLQGGQFIDRRPAAAPLANVKGCFFVH